MAYNNPTSFECATERVFTLGWDGNVTYFIQCHNLQLCFQDVLARKIFT